MKPLVFITTKREKPREKHFVTLLGGLHIEMAALNVIGDRLEDSSWVEALVQAKVASAGTAESFLKATHVTRTRHAHQVTASCLYILLKKSYASYLELSEPGDQHQAFEEWCVKCKQEAPQFNFRYTAFQLELFVLSIWSVPLYLLSNGIKRLIQCDHWD